MAPKKDAKPPPAKGGGGGAMGVTPAPPRYPEGEVCFLSTTLKSHMWKDLWTCNSFCYNELLLKLKKLQLKVILTKS